MIDPTNLLIDKKENIFYYFAKETPICNSCKNECFDTLILHQTWDRKRGNHKEHTYCINCMDKIRKYGEDELKTCVITYTMMEHLDLIIKQPAQLVGSSSTWDSNVIYKGEGEIVDNTKYAGRIDTNATQKIEHNKKLLEQRDKELGDNAYGFIAKEQEKVLKGIPRTPYKDELDIDSFFDNIKNSVPAIEQKEKKLLENK